MCAGNAGFETANHIVGNAAYIHMASRYIQWYIPCATTHNNLSVFVKESDKVGLSDPLCWRCEVGNLLTTNTKNTVMYVLCTHSPSQSY